MVGLEFGPFMEIVNQHNLEEWGWRIDVLG